MLNGLIHPWMALDEPHRQSRSSDGRYSREMWGFLKCGEPKASINGRFHAAERFSALY
jgi:hypothetical protein